MKFSDDVSGFVSIGEMIPDVLLDIRYYSSFNFVGERINGYEEPVAFLTRELAAIGRAFSMTTRVVCEEFERVYP